MADCKSVDQPIEFFFFGTEEELIASGVTPQGATTSGNYELIYGIEGDVLNALVGKQAAFPDLPATGELVIKGQIYQFDEILVKCRQEHNRTANNPADIPSCFLTYQEDGAGVEWMENEWVELGMRRTDQGIVYQCIQAHQCLSTWRPASTPSLWIVVPDSGDIPEWVQPAGAHDAYQVGDQVLYNGETWESTAANNVWAPGVYGWVQV